MNRKVQVAFGSAIAALLVVGLVSYRGIVMTTESDRWVQHTHAVLENLGALLSATESLESSYRGFALTGNESYFETYRASILDADQAIQRIRTLTVDNGSQQRRILALEKLISQKIAFGDSVIGLRRTMGEQAAADSIRAGSGQKIMQEFQALVREMQNEELRLLVLRHADAKRRVVYTNTILLLGIMLGVIIALAAAWSAQRDHLAREIAENARREGEELFGTLANNISQLAWMADKTGYIFWYNQRWFDYTGTTLQEMAGWGWQKVHHPDHVQRVVEKIKHSFETGELWDDTFPLKGRDGVFRSFLSRAVPIRDSEGKIARWFGTHTDVSDRQAMEEELFAEKERAQVTLDSIGDAVICTDLAGKITFLNVVAEKMTGWSRLDATDRPIAEVFRIRDDSRELISNPVGLAIVQNRSVNLPSNCQLIQRDSTEIPIEDSISPIHDRQGRTTGAVIVFRDVSKAQAMTRQMTYSAQHDFLTGLPNRMLLNDRITQAIVLAPRHHRKVAVLFLDLDGFKHINDSLGHATGDKLLQSIASRLTSCVRESDTVSRQGGDEFVLLLSEIHQPEDAAISARRILETIAEAHTIEGRDLHITTSIGISVHPEDGIDAEALIKNADTAMYHAKENGRQSYQFFTPAMNVRAVARQSIEQGLRHAVERQEFILNYQPKVNLETRSIMGAEALVRWNNPLLGVVPPSDFISVAEDSGLIVPIGRWVLREACMQTRAWLDAGLELSSVAVNVSAMELRDEHFVKSVFDVLDEAGLNPNILELELTESVLMKNAESIETILKTLRTSGVRIAIDDFGTGYSSLSYLQKFPIDSLKIDQSFVRQIAVVPNQAAIVTAIINMGRSLNLRVVAEGVETREQLAFLRAQQCNEAQGYYFSRPVAAQQFADLLKNGLSEALSASTTPL